MNIDGSEEPCYLRTVPLYATAEQFEIPTNEYKLRTEYDKELVKKYKK